MQHHLVFVSIILVLKYFFVLHQLFFDDIKYFFVQHQHVFVDTKLRFVQRQCFVSTQSYFSCNTKFLFWTSFRMSCHGDIFLLSHSNKNIITCQKINKFPSLCGTKKLVSFFLHHNFFIFSFYITHCQHVDLLRSCPGNKETFYPSFTQLSDIPKHLLSRSCSRKKLSYYLGLLFVKRLRWAHIIVKLQACFTQILQKLIP